MSQSSFQNVAIQIIDSTSDLSETDFDTMCVVKTTGEIIPVAEIYDKDHVLVSQIVMRKYAKSMNFYSIRHQSERKLIRELPPGQYMLFCFMRSHASYGGRVNYNSATYAQQLGYHRKVIQRNCSALVKRGLVYWRDGHLHVSPEHFQKGGLMAWISQLKSWLRDG